VQERVPATTRLSALLEAATPILVQLIRDGERQGLFSPGDHDEGGTG
jgi:hypothetical protein